MFVCSAARLRVTSETGEFVNLHSTSGDPYLYETVSGSTFRVSPDAFLQLNTRAAEVLYDTVREYAGLSKDTVLLDVCCGIGV